MGLLFSSIWERFRSRKPMQIMLVGLDAAGKTTILYKLKLGENVTTIPTIGFNAERIEFRNITFTMWDIGGQEKIRPLWRYYYENNDGIIFVVDSNDRERIKEAKEELAMLMNAEQLRNSALLVYANKQDLPNAMTASQIAQELELSSLRNRDWFIQSACAVSGDGLFDGLDWFSKVLSKK